jgi:SAM-dependent methyltransferase
MREIVEHYDAYPYPARDPEDERRRLVTGSPSWLPEVEHFLFGGRRDWSRPFRVLVAGGGTGDGLIQLAALLDHDRRAAEITYLDLSPAAREIAERRAKVRGLSGIRFVTGDLLTAPDLGRFDYIDCCGVLHHLPEPQAGFDALAGALDPEGGIGLMVYAPYGRSGVYPLQEAFRTLLSGLSPVERLAQARRLLERVPQGHPFRRNPHLSDHMASDAGFYDLLLHAQDRAFRIDELAAMLAQAGLGLVAPATPALYDLARLLPEDMVVPEGLSPVERMAAAERLRGTIRTHVVYAAPAARVASARATGRAMSLVPLLRDLDAGRLARQVAQTGRLALEAGGAQMDEALSADAAPLVAGIDGRRSLAQIAAQAEMDPMGFLGLWGRVERVLGDWGLMHYCSPVPA